MQRPHSHRHKRRRSARSSQHEIALHNQKLSESLERLYFEIEVNYDMKVTRPELMDGFFRMLGFTDEVTDNGDGTYTHTFKPPTVFHDFPGSCPKCGSVGGCPTSCPNFYQH